MATEFAQLIRTAKRLQEATGYLELGMTQHTLDCLENVDDTGPFEGDIALLRSKALRMQHRYHDAAILLETVATAANSEASKTAWLTLSLCYQMTGNFHQAINALAQARGARAREDEGVADG